MVISLKHKDLLESNKIDREASEYSLIEGLKKGDRTSQTACYKRYCGKMYALAFRYIASREDAKEVVNTAFLSVFRAIHSYQSKGSFEGWIRTIVKRAAIDYCRKYVYSHTSTYEIMDIDVHVYNDAVDHLNAEDFLQLIVKVPKASRTVFNLFAIEGYSHKEISNTLNISEGTSKWHLANARKKLMEMIKLESYGYGK